MRRWRTKNVCSRTARSTLGLAAIICACTFEFAADAAPAKKKLSRPVLTTANGEELHALNIELLKSRASSAFIDVTDTISPLSSAIGWKIYMVDFKTSNIIWSKDGSGLPPAKIPWDGRDDTGTYVTDGSRLGIKISVTTNEGSVASEVLEFDVVERQAFLKKVDIGLHFQPRAGIGIANGSFTSDDPNLPQRKLSVAPTIITDLSFHQNRTHFLSIVLKSGSDIQESVSTTGSVKIRADQYSMNSIQYQYLITNQLFKDSVSIAAGSEIFRIQLRSIDMQTADYGETGVNKYAMQVQGAAATITSRVHLTASTEIDFGLRYGQGLDDQKGTFLDYGAGTSVGLTSNVDLRLVYTQQQIAQDASTGQHLKSTVQSLDLFLELLL